MNLEGPEAYVYSNMLVALGVCTPGTWTADQVNAWLADHRPLFAVNLEWRFSPSASGRDERGLPTFGMAEASPVPCDRAPGRLHWIATRTRGPMRQYQGQGLIARQEAPRLRLVRPTEEFHL